MSTTPSASQSRITTAEELAGFENGTVVRDRDGRIWEKEADPSGAGLDWQCMGGTFFREARYIVLPADLLYPLPAAPPVSDTTAKLGGLYLASTEDAIKALGIPDGDDEPMPTDIEACGCDGEMGLRHLIWHLARRSDTTAATITRVLSEHRAGTWTDHTVSCHGCRQRAEADWQEKYDERTPDERETERRKVLALVHPVGRTWADHDKHVTDAVLAALGLTVTERSEVLTDKADQ